MKIILETKEDRKALADAIWCLVYGKNNINEVFKPKCAVRAYKHATFVTGVMDKTLEESK